MENTGTVTMEELRRQIAEITGAPAKTVEERIDAVFALREALMPDDERERQRFDAEYFAALLGMVREANAGHGYDIEMFQLYTLLAETYVGIEEFRKLRPLAEGVLALMDDCDVSFQVIEQAVPRIIDAVGASVYNHDRYRLLGAYLRAASRAASDDEIFDEDSAKERMREMLNLRGLLDKASRPDILDGELMAFISFYIQPDEFGKLIDEPREGHLKRDPVEYTERWEEVYYDAKDETDAQFAGTHRFMGFCFMYWSAFRTLLAEKYGIDWHSPAQMNPGVMFD